MDTQQILATKGSQVITVRPDDTIVMAARTLEKNCIGAVIVTNDVGEIIGILSERDISNAVGRKKGDLTRLRVQDLMSKRVVICTPYDSIVELFHLMESNGIRHLPVVENGDLVGIISLRDVVNNWLGSTEVENAELRRRLGALQDSVAERSRQA